MVAAPSVRERLRRTHLNAAQAMWSGEPLGELLSQSIRRRICDLIDVLPHLIPGLRLCFVFSILQLLNLLDVMSAVCQQEPLQYVLRQVRV